MKKLLPCLLFLLIAAGLRAQCAPQVDCPAPPVQYADTTTNHPQLWNTPDWWEPVLGTHDFPEAPVTIKLLAHDTCGAGLQANLRLLLDLDSDGVMETVLDSDSLFGYVAGEIPFGNLNNPNYNGETRVFDSRPVNLGDRYRFAFVQNANGNDYEFRLVWTTDNAPDVYVDPQLPALLNGQYGARWFVEDGNGNAVPCNYNFTVTDGAAPTVTCVNGVPATMMPVGLLTLWATDFVLTGSDNTTPAGQLQYGVRKSGMGTGFPVDAAGNPVMSVNFNCSELGAQFVEIWARDVAGNTSFCESFALVQDILNVCTGLPLDSLKVCFEDCCTGQPSTVDSIQIYLQGNLNGAPIPSIFGAWTRLPGPDNCYVAGFGNALPLAGNYFIRPQKNNNPLEGVTTYDLLLMSQHILGLQPFDAACQYIAADANRSNSITTFDIVELRKLLLGLYTTLPNNTPGWRFIYKDSTFTNSGNPFSSMPFWQEQAPVNALTNPFPDPFVFVPVKVGDVSCTEPVTGDDLGLCVPDSALQAGDTVQVPVSFAEAFTLLGFQLDLHYSAQLTLLDLEPGILPGIPSAAANFGVEHRLTISWINSLLTNVTPGDPLFYLVFKVEQPTSLAQALSLGVGPLVAEAYDDSLHRRPLVLEFCMPSSTTNPASLALGAVRPNPARLGTPVIVPVQATEPSQVRYEVLDLAGRVLVSGHTELPAGATQLAIPTSTIGQPGLYLYRVQAGAENYLGKIMLQ